jgi:hypothetical protein
MSTWISCRIRTSSHTLTPAAFRVLQLAESTIRVSDVQSETFRIAFGHFNEQDIPERTKVHHAHNGTLIFLVALNVATIGLFYWAVDPWTHPVYGLQDEPESAPVRMGSLIATPDTTFEKRKDLTDFDVQNALIIFGMLAKEKDQFLEREYIRGILLLRMSFYDINFCREAFMCFWRALENFIGVRILKVSKLKNELRDLQRGLTMVGASTELVSELRDVYAIRSSQVAHAQVAPRLVTFDEVMKTKVFLDFVMHKTFKAQGVQILETLKS